MLPVTALWMVHHWFCSSGDSYQCNLDELAYNHSFFNSGIKFRTHCSAVWNFQEDHWHHWESEGAKECQSGEALWLGFSFDYTIHKQFSLCLII